MFKVLFLKKRIKGLLAWLPLIYHLLFNMHHMSACHLVAAPDDSTSTTHLRRENKEADFGPQLFQLVPVATDTDLHK